MVRHTRTALVGFFGMGYRSDRSRRLLDELDYDAARAGAFLLDLRHAQPADLARIGDVSAAAGLQVHAVDLEEAYAPNAARRLHRHGAHELGLRVELLVGDPDGADLMALGNKPRELALEVLAIEVLDHVEVEARVLRGNRTAVGLVRNDRAQQVRRGVESH